jgi:hypothetical protein
MPRRNLIVLLLLLITGCTLSLNPLFTANQLVFDPTLAGVWKGKQTDAAPDANTNMTFTLQGRPDIGKKYFLLTDMKDQPQGRFGAELGVIGTNRFLQIVPMKPSSIGEKSFYGAHFIQAYSFWKVVLDRDKLKLIPLNYQWIEAMAKQKQLDIRYEQREGDFIILTASTQELQAFIRKYADDPGAFGGGLEFERQK